MNDLTNYVYIMSNISYGDDVFKIGWTKKHPLKRAIELHTSGIPTPFVVESVITTMEGSKLEKQIHNHLTQYRMNDNREFFKISKDNLTKILTTELNLELTLITELDDTCHSERPQKHNCEQKMEEKITNNAKYVCEACEYHCNKKSHYAQHCETEKHKQISNKAKFICDACNYHCNKKSHYVQHCETEKHKQTSKKDGEPTAEMKTFMESMMKMHKDMLATFVETMKENPLASCACHAHK